MNSIVPALETALVIVVGTAVAGCGSGVTSILYGGCVGDHGAVFTLRGSIVEASPPFSTADEVSGCVRLTEEAAAAGSDSEGASGILGFRVLAGRESWSGSGSDFLVRAPRGLRGGVEPRFRISADGDSLLFEYGESVRGSDPSGFVLVLTTREGRPALIVSRPSTADPVAVSSISLTRS